ncbi:hypothetical protein BKA69DRAFT_1085055, partial [Paraphysoderma sedebokerense]
MMVASKLWSIFDEPALLNFFDQHDIKHTHAVTIYKYVLSHPDIYSLRDFNDCPNLPKALPALLNANFTPLITTVDQIRRSQDGTVKLAVRLPNMSLVETVIMHYDRRNEPDRKPRSSVCLSSQVGCKMACGFCATGTMGFKSNLSSAEIIEQLVHARQIKQISSVVFMGMGEPLDNYNNVILAIKSMTDQRRFGIGPSHICVSTVGVIGKFQSLMRDAPAVKLALSLHAPNQELRLKIVPTAKAYPFDKLMKAVDDYLEKNDRIMIEYILIANVNCSVESAHELGRLLQTRNVLLNLIPYNPTEVSADYEAPTPEMIQTFESILRYEYKILTIVRRTLGQDIDGACGQLVVKKENSCGSGGKNSEIADIEDIFTLKKRPPIVRKKSVQISDNVTTYPIQSNNQEIKITNNVLKGLPSLLIMLGCVLVYRLGSRMMYWM